eukprot:GHVU01051384.1.p2 GENE.GHVU01051384.1~~GHVU01051384.1.p2  ORF type:complete len:109 (+),score=3.37 GHVU01051384.1:904-1230(+)
MWTWQERAWQEAAVCIDWFRRVFLQYCGPARPQLLIMDQHATHDVLDLLEEAVANNIILLGLPPHTSHWLQPFDKGCLNSAYNRVCTEYMSRGLGSDVDDVNVKGQLP